MQITQKKDKNRAYWCRFLVYFIIAGAFMTAFIWLIIDGLVQEQRTHKHYLLESKADDIEERMDLLIARVHAMRFMLLADEGEPENFDELAALVLKGWDDEKDNIVHNVALAPLGVVEHVYPLKGNEPLIGYNLWDAASAHPETMETLRQGKVCITPPIELVQGGTGINICLPITLLGEEEPWGMAAIVVDQEKLVQSFGLKDLYDHDAQYSLEYLDINGEYTAMVCRGTVHQPVTYEFQTENMHWRLSITATLDKAGMWGVLLLCVGGVVVTALLAFMLAGSKMKKQMNELFRDLANTDSVTGCCSRHFVYEKLVNKDDGSWNYPEMQYSLAILDVDHFKDVNDTLGHEVGDLILQEMAKIMLNAINREKGDCVIRFGGDEFVLLFGNRTREQLKDILFHVLSSVRKLDVPQMEGTQVTVSIGGVHPDEMKEEATYKNLLRAADAKLYGAKDSGRNRCIV